MRTILYTDGSIIEDTITFTSDTLSIEILGYKPGSLYLLTEHTYTYQEYLPDITISLNREVTEPITIPIIYTTSDVTGQINYTYDLDTRILDVSLQVENGLNLPISGPIGIGTVSSLTDVDTDILEYSILGTFDVPAMTNNEYSLSTTSVGYLEILVDEANLVGVLTLTINRVKNEDVYPPYPGLVSIVRGGIQMMEEQIDYLNPSIFLGEEGI